MCVFPAVRPARLVTRTHHTRVAAAPRAQETKEVGTGGVAVAIAGLVANPIVDISALTLFQTGSGLPPGPGGAYGAAGETCHVPLPYMPHNAGNTP